MRKPMQLRMSVVAPLVGVLASPTVALAQVANTCAVALSYAPLPSSAAVPTLNIIGLGVLGAAVGVIGWRRTRHKGVKALSVVAMASAVALAMHGGEGVIREVRAAGPYALVQALGGVLSDTFVYATPTPIQTVTNTSGVPLRITANDNVDETGSCTVGTILAPGQSCTTAPVCTPPVLQPLAVSTPPTWACGPEQYASYMGPGYTLIVNRPAIQPPSFSPALPPVNWSVTPDPLVPDSVTPDPGLANATALATFNATVTATAPSGYGFGPALQPTMTWPLGPLVCGSSDGTGGPP